MELKNYEDRIAQGDNIEYWVVWLLEQSFDTSGADAGPRFLI